MFPIKRYRVRSFEMGLLFRDGEFRGLLDEGTHWFVDPLRKVAVEVVSQRAPQWHHTQLELIVKTSADLGRTVVLVTHDRDHARRHATRVVELQDGRIARDERPGAAPLAAVSVSAVAPSSVESFNSRTGFSCNSC